MTTSPASSIANAAMVSPFGGECRSIARLSTEVIVDMYRRKCGADIRPHLTGLSEVELFECSRTGYRFWGPQSVAADESFYRLLSAYWPDYYRPTRWEYGFARRALRPTSRVLEIGAGRGYFIKAIERIVTVAVGLELNESAIAEKVCESEIRSDRLEDYAATIPPAYDVVCAFQVLEHLRNPASFFSSALALLADGGRLILSVPNREYCPFALMEDPFDLPPHHVGHFNPQVFRSLAQMYGLRMEAIVCQPCPYEPMRVSATTERSLVWRTFRGASAWCGSLLLRVMNEPGPTVVVSMRKQSVG